jgi:hypothetical protein
MDARNGGVFLLYKKMIWGEDEGPCNLNGLRWTVNPIFSMYIVTD